MQTNNVIDDQPITDSLRTTGLQTKHEAVELRLRALLRLRQQEELRTLRGKLNWQGDLNAMRYDKQSRSIDGCLMPPYRLEPR